MTHETESPAPPAAPASGDGEEGLPFQHSVPAPASDDPASPGGSGHVMSPGVPHHPRPQTIAGMGNVPPSMIPAAPLTEVAPAPAFRSDLPRDVAQALAFTAPDADPNDFPSSTTVPSAPPSATMVGFRAPLHTAAEANTQVDASSLTPGDAERIISAAEAQGKSGPRARGTLVGPPPALPPPPPMRRSSYPPPPALDGGRGTTSGVGPAANLASPRLPPPAALPSPVSRQPAPPPARPRALTLPHYGDEPTDVAPKPAATPFLDSARGSVRNMFGRKRPSETLKPGPVLASSRPPPPPPGPASRESSEDLSSALLVDDTGEHRPQPRVPPQPISSSSLVDDPGSDDDLALEEDVAPPPSPPPRTPPPTRSPAPAPAHAYTPPAPPGASSVRGPYPSVSASEPAVVVQPQPPPSKPAFDLVSPSEPTTMTRRPERATEPPARPRPPSVVQPPPSSASSFPPWLVPVLAVGGAVALAISLASVVLAIRWMQSPSVERPAASAAPAASAPAPTASSSGAPSAGSTTTAAQPGAAPTAASATRPSEGTGAPAGSPCVLAGAPHTVATRALLRGGIESATNADRIALGIALSEKDGLVVALDPSTFAAVESTPVHADAPLRRVVPVLGPELTAFFETNKRHKGIEAVHPVPGNPPFVVGAVKGSMVWAPTRSSAPTPLWPITGDVPVEAIRAVVLPDHAGYAIAFRQGASIFLGGLNEDRTMKGGLVRIAGLGTQIGAPAMAAGQGHVLVAWSDRPSPAAPWSIRWLTWRPGTDPSVPTVFPVPAGGSGGQVMSPALASLTGGRYVIAWTEGAGARHEVRAQALDPTEHAVGSALTVSGDGVNAGQGTPAMTPDGRGAVVFLANPAGALASVVAVPIICP